MLKYLLLCKLSVSDIKDVKDALGIRWDVLVKKWGNDDMNSMYVHIYSLCHLEPELHASVYIIEKNYFQSL
jgi:hypothetical protein